MASLDLNKIVRTAIKRHGEVIGSGTARLDDWLIESGDMALFSRLRFHQGGHEPMFKEASGLPPGFDLGTQRRIKGRFQIIEPDAKPAILVALRFSVPGRAQESLEGCEMVVLFPALQVRK